jgi:hypothetical protein
MSIIENWPLLKPNTRAAIEPGQSAPRRRYIERAIAGFAIFADSNSRRRECVRFERQVFSASHFWAPVCWPRSLYNTKSKKIGSASKILALAGVCAQTPLITLGPRKDPLLVLFVGLICVKGV